MKNYKSEVNTKDRHTPSTIAMKLVYFVLSFVALASAELEIRDFTQNEARNVDLNKLVDRFIPQIAEFIVKHGLDPLNLPRTERRLWVQLPDPTFDTSVEPMIYRADLVLHSGKLERLSNLKRYGDAILVYKDNIVNIEVGFEFKLLEGTYDYILKLVFYNLAGRVKAVGETVRVKVNISFNTMDYTLALNKFELQIAGNIKVKFDEKGLAGAIKTAIANIIVPFFKNILTNIVQQEVANAIRLYFSEINWTIAPRRKLKPIFNYKLLNLNK